MTDYVVKVRLYDGNELKFSFSTENFDLNMTVGQEGENNVSQLDSKTQGLIAQRVTKIAQALSKVCEERNKALGLSTTTSRGAVAGALDKF